MRKRLLTGALIGLSAAVGCGPSDEVSPGAETIRETQAVSAADWQGWEENTGLGLRFAVPPGRTIEQRDTHIELKNPAAYRTADVIEIYPDVTPPALRVGDGPVISEGNAPATYQVRENAGGSGGLNYTLFTAKVLNGQTVSLLAVFETESGVPSFAESWAVWESLQAAE